MLPGMVVLSNFVDFAVFLVVRLIICVIQACSIEHCQIAGRWLAYLCCDVLRIRHKVTKENLRIAYPDISESQRRKIVRDMWEHLFLMACEIAHVPRKIHETNFHRYVKFHRKPELVGYMLNQRPTVLVTGHVGNFEVAGYAAALLGFKLHTIARDLDNRYLHDFVNSFRSQKGQIIFPKEGSSGLIQGVIENNGILAVVGDQHAGPNGCWVDFMGRLASNYKSLAVLGLVGGAPLVVTYARRLGKPMHFEIGINGIADPADLDPAIAGVRELTQWYNHRLEEVIRVDPGQYWWVHRRWKGEPSKRKRREKRVSRPPVEKDAA